MKARDDVAFRHARAFEFVGNGEISVISLHPDFAVDDFEMSQNVVNAFVALQPSEMIA